MTATQRYNVEFAHLANGLMIKELEEDLKIRQFNQRLYARILKKAKL